MGWVGLEPTSSGFQPDAFTRLASTPKIKPHSLPRLMENELRILMEDFHNINAENTQMMTTINDIVQSNAKLLIQNADRMESLTSSIERIALITERLMNRLDKLEANYTSNVNNLS
jgi:hypothetical protein